MKLLDSSMDFFGLDMGTTAMRAVQLKGSGPVKTLRAYGQVAADGQSFASDSNLDRAKMVPIIKQLLKQSGITSKNVAVNLPSDRVFTAVIDMDKMAPEELDKTMRYQADALIPTPLAESKVDWVVLGDSPKDSKKQEVLVSSVPNTVAVARLELLEAAGLNVIAIEPDSTALARSTLAYDSTAPQMALDMGNVTTDLLVAIGGVPRLSRALPFGSQSFIQAVKAALSADDAQAQQYIYKFGLSKDKLDGQVYNALISNVEGLMSEIDKSIKFFQARYNNAALDRIVVTGSASVIPEFPLYIANRFNINVEIGNAWRNINYPASLQNELVAISNHFAVATGLAERDA